MEQRCLFWWLKRVVGGCEIGGIEAARQTCTRQGNEKRDTGVGRVPKPNRPKTKPHKHSREGKVSSLGVRIGGDEARGYIRSEGSGSQQKKIRRKQHPGHARNSKNTAEGRKASADVRHSCCWRLVTTD